MHGALKSPYVAGYWTNDCVWLDWPQEETEQGQVSNANGANTHLWEESWDDDDESEDFSKQLKYAALSFSPFL